MKRFPRIPGLTRWRHGAARVALLAVLLVPTAAMAQDDEEYPDARLTGLEQEVKIEDGSSALSYLLLAALGVLCIGVMFKNAKRTHLD